MTLVYSREGPEDQPRTHAFLIGCGRFPHYAQNGSADRPATAAGARAMTRFLIDHADALVAPLATVEVCLSDPAIATGADQLAIGPYPNDPRADDGVDSALRALVETAGLAWTARCRPGDHMVFYMASHGVADANGAAGLLEDVASQPNRRWNESLNITVLGQGLSQLDPGGAWVFLDACQDVVTDFLTTIAVSGVILVEINVQKLAKARVKALALAGSRFGASAWAPNSPDPPIFTQTLLKGLGGACVKNFDGLGWAVSAASLQHDLPGVAEAALDYRVLEVESLIGFNGRGPLLTVAAPRVPISVRTATESHLAFALAASATTAGGQTVHKPGGASTWRFEVAPDGAHYQVQAAFPPHLPVYADGGFDAFPPACSVILKP